MIGRLSKIAMCAALGLFAALVVFDNVVDATTNFAFVRHVLSMDTTHPGNVLMYRAVTSPQVWWAAFVGIVVGEAATAVLFLVGAIVLWTRRNASPACFHHAKGWIHAAGAAGFLVWFFGFAVVGGEWFQMWQSAEWNGQEPAFRFTMVILAVVIFVSLPEDQSGGR